MRLNQFIAYVALAAAAIGIGSFLSGATVGVVLLRIVIVLATLQVGYFIHMVMISKELDRDVLGSDRLYDHHKTKISLAPREEAAAAGSD
ncbi:MAG: hypothetical protein ACSHXD_04410 [Marinosulfonomonas sp.]